MTREERRARDQADALWSRLVKQRDGHRCRACGKKSGPMEAAHIMGRRYSRVRCYLPNGLTLCGGPTGCHRAEHDGDLDLADIVGAEHFERLRRLAHDTTWKRPAGWWSSQLADLRARDRSAA